MARKKLNDTTEGQVLYQSDYKCCVCNKKSGQIHHIDGDNSNNSFDNLTFLCLNCHADAELKSTMLKRLTPTAIKLYRDDHYVRVNRERRLLVKTSVKPINSLTIETLENAAITAAILLELAKLRLEYFNARWDEREYILNRLSLYTELGGYRVCFEVLEFMLQIAEMTRSGMPNKMASQIHSITHTYLATIYNAISKKEATELGKLCINIGFNIVYDAFIKLNNYYIAQWGLSLFKLVYMYAQPQKNTILLEKIEETYTEFKSTLERPERPDLKLAIELVDIFKDDISQGNLAFPLYPDSLTKKVFSQAI